MDGGRPDAEVIPGSGSKGRKVGNKIRILIRTIIDADPKNLKFFELLLSNAFFKIRKYR